MSRVCVYFRFLSFLVLLSLSALAGVANSAETVKTSNLAVRIPDTGVCVPSRVYFALEAADANRQAPVLSEVAKIVGALRISHQMKCDTGLKEIFLRYDEEKNTTIYSAAEDDGWLVKSGPLSSYGFFSTNMNDKSYWPGFSLNSLGILSFRNLESERIRLQKIDTVGNYQIRKNHPDGLQYAPYCDSFDVVGDQNLNNDENYEVLLLHFQSGDANLIFKITREDNVSDGCIFTEIKWGRGRTPGTGSTYNDPESTQVTKYVRQLDEVLLTARNSVRREYIETNFYDRGAFRYRFLVKKRDTEDAAVTSWYAMNLNAPKEPKPEPVVAQEPQAVHPLTNHPRVKYFVDERYKPWDLDCAFKEMEKYLPDLSLKKLKELENAERARSGFLKKIERYKESDHRLKDYLISIELEKVKLAEEKIAKLSNPDFQPNYEYTDAEIRSAYYDVGRSKACRVTERIQQHYEWSCSTETWTKNKEGANFKNHCACVGKTAGELWLDMNTDRWKSDVAIALGVEAGLRCDQ